MGHALKLHKAISCLRKLKPSWGGGQFEGQKKIGGGAFAPPLPSPSVTDGNTIFRTIMIVVHVILLYS